MLTMTANGSGSKELERLLAQIAAMKDQAAFAELYSATKGKLFSSVLMIVRRSDLAEEIIQDAYVRIWLNASAYRPSCGSPMSWMISIARNLAIDMARKPTREICPGEPVLQALPGDGLTADEAEMFSALQALDADMRNLMIAAYISGESRAQLAKRTGMPVNTVKTSIRRTLLEVEANLRNTGKHQADMNVGFGDAPQVKRTSRLEQVPYRAGR